MSCKHGRFNPLCSSYEAQIAGVKRDYEKYVAPREGVTPDSRNFSVVDVKEVGPHLVLKVQYPNCRDCSFEGQKVMVFLNTTVVAAIKWRTIDPHFRGEAALADPTVAPSPCARFPATDLGWVHALDYARSLGKVQSV